MSNTKNIGQSRPTLKEFWEKFEAHSFNSIRGVLTNAMIEEACRTANWSYRKRCITPTLVVLHLVLAAIWPDNSFAASWQVLWGAMCAMVAWPEDKIAPGSDTLAKARKRVPLAVWTYLMNAVAHFAASRGGEQDLWRGFRPVLADGFCVSMPDEPALLEEFGTSGHGRRKGRFPLARVVAIGLSRSRTILGYALGAYREAETSLIKKLLPLLQPKDLLIADRFFASAHAYALYLKNNLAFITRVHQRVKIASLRKICIYSPSDMVVEMPLGSKYHRLFPDLPETVIVRLIWTTIHTREGRQTIWLATALLSAEDYPAKEIVALYGERWRIETLFREFKVDLSADVLRSKTPDGIRKEIAARFVALNVVHALMLEAAVLKDADPLRISFVQALRTILSFAPAFAYAPITCLPTIYQRMLAELARRVVPYRPGRQEPRMIKREKKHYPSLKITRQQWRERIPA